MGKIFDEVVTSHLAHYPHERSAILPFQAEFDITWGARRSAYGSDFSSYIVRPDPAIRQIFGLGLEVALFVFDYATIEARTFQAINRTMEEEPLLGRVEPSSYFVLSADPRAPKWVAEYLMRIPQTRSPIPLSFDQLRLALTDQYKLRDFIAQFAFRRDLFDYKLPIDSDAYFFGRETIVSELVDQFKKRQNTGIFGLRKTGKTSLLYKFQRHVQANAMGRVLYVDCKSPTIRKKTAEQLISYLTRQAADLSNIPTSRYSKLDAYEAFEEVFRLASKRTPICIIFDEIEYISPFSLTDTHWAVDFIDFWQLLWSLQSRTGQVCFTVCGVNPTVSEVDTFNKVQNPLFGIVNNKYLQGLDSESLRRMVQHFGGQMGLNFSDASVKSLERHYGGHPLLTRMACSYVHKELESSKKGRPIAISNEFIESMLDQCDHDITPYCAHIVSELRDFYPDEFSVLKMSSIGQKSDFYDYAKDPELNRHLLSYGIVKIADNGTPEVVLSVLRNYLRMERSRDTGGKISRDIVELGRRERWVKDILSRIIRDLRSLMQAAPNDIRRPFGVRGIPDSDILLSISPVSNGSEFENFSTILYKIFYENIVRSYVEKFAFFSEFKKEWPALFLAVDRVRVYRDTCLHLDVSPGTRASYEAYIAIDLDGQTPEEAPDGWFILQQVILDELLYASQVEAAAKIQ